MKLARAPFKMSALTLMLGLCHASHADVAFLGEGASINTMSGNGNIVAGSLYTPETGSSAYLVNGSTITELGKLDGFTDAYAQGVSDDGGVVAGNSTKFDANWNYYSSAFRWTPSGGMVALDGLAAGANTYANAVSADGSSVVGSSSLDSDPNNYAAHAVRWVGAGAAEDLTAGSSGWLTGNNAYSSALAVSGDGSVITGYGKSTGDTIRAFRWTEAGGMENLGALSDRNASEGKAISKDGLVIAGNSYTYLATTPDTRAFRWTAAGGMQNLGVLNGMDLSYAYGINADGSVIVGYSTKTDYSSQAAYRWTDTSGMQSVADWLAANSVSVTAGTEFHGAYDVSDDGNTILGFGKINGTHQPFMAKVGGTVGVAPLTGGYTGGGYMGQTEFNQSMAESAGSVGTMGGGLANMAINGAHHRLLMDNGLKASNCMWVTADGGRDPDASNRQALGEIGACTDVGPLRVGAGVGASEIKQDTALGGDTEYSGKHLVLEADYKLPGSSAIASLTGFYGAWDVSVQRNYLAPGLTTSVGNTDARVWSLRARVDFPDAAKLAGFSLSAFAAYNHSHSHVDGYTEVGGVFPATVNDYDDSQREVRLGLRGKTPLSQATDLLLSVEAIHLFDGAGAISGSAGLLVFSVPGASLPDNLVRAGIEVDHRLNDQALLNASVQATHGGGDTSYVASLGLRYGF